VTGGLEIELTGAPAGAPPAERTRTLVVAALAARGITDGHIAINYVDDEQIAALNAEHRGKEGPTDVLSFPIDGTGPAAGPRELGDIVICAARTTDLEQAIVHGALHLTGMDHETDEGQMLALQDELIERLR